MSCLNELILQAVSQLEGAKKRVVDRRLKRIGAMEEAVDNVAAKLCDELRFNTLATNVVALFNQDSFNGATSLAIDPELLKQLIELIVKALIQLFFGG